MKVIIKCVLPQQSTTLHKYSTLQLYLLSVAVIDTYVRLYGSHFLLRLDLDHTSNIGKLSLLYALYANHLGILDSISVIVLCFLNRIF